MQGELPFYESPENALRACVEALGGAKKVGASLFPDKTIENARDYLLACLNHERAEKLTLSQIMFILKSAKQIGFHSAMEFLCREVEYEARPITPEEEADRLALIIAESSKTLERAIQALGKVQGSTIKRVA